MAWRLFGAKPLPWAMLTYRQLHLYEQTSVIFEERCILAYSVILKETRIFGYLISQPWCPMSGSSSGTTELPTASCSLSWTWWSIFQWLRMFSRSSSAALHGNGGLQPTLTKTVGYWRKASPWCSGALRFTIVENNIAAMAKCISMKLWFKTPKTISQRCH